MLGEFWDLRCNLAVSFSHSLSLSCVSRKDLILWWASPMLKRDDCGLFLFVCSSFRTCVSVVPSYRSPQFLPCTMYRFQRRPKRLCSMVNRTTGAAFRREVFAMHQGGPVGVLVVGSSPPIATSRIPCFALPFEARWDLEEF